MHKTDEVIQNIESWVASKNVWLIALLAAPVGIAILILQLLGAVIKMVKWIEDYINNPNTPPTLLALLAVTLAVLITIVWYLISTFQ